MAQIQTGEAKALRPKKHGWRYDLRKNKVIYLMFLPLMIYYVIFHYLPMFGVVMAFMKYKPAKGFFGSQWVGMANYIKFFRGPYASSASRPRSSSRCCSTRCRPTATKSCARRSATCRISCPPWWRAAS